MAFADFVTSCNTQLSLMNKDDIYDILYQVSTTVIDLVVVFALFVFMLVLLCFCVATVFR